MSGRTVASLCALIVALLAGPGPALAHETTRSYLTLAREGGAVTARLRMAFRDLEFAVGLDEDLDGAITWGEAERSLDAVESLAIAGVVFEAGGACTARRTDARPMNAAGVAYLDLDLAVECAGANGPLTLRSRLFADIDPDHRMFVTASLGEAETSAVLSAAAPSLEISGDSAGRAASFRAYFRSGVAHLLEGRDHLVFLFVLMLPAICARTGLRRAVTGVVAAVTGFTLAHAVTLTAAATELLRPPAGLVELLIALSIVVTAVDNVRPFLRMPRAGLAAFFGIIHGFGFASALGALEMTGGALAVAILGFNLGIEVAQIGVVLAVLPVLYLLGAGRWLLWIGSGLAALVGLWWMWERLLPMLQGI